MTIEQGWKAPSESDRQYFLELWKDCVRQTQAEIEKVWNYIDDNKMLIAPDVRWNFERYIGELKYSISAEAQREYCIAWGIIPG